MKNLTIKDIQQISLCIMKDVHDFCVKNNIRYSLAYGTLIGAIRHQGFIPWDDDLDIVMPRPDYERFCKSYKSSNGYKISAPSLSNSYLNYARVYEDDLTMVRPLAPWCPDKTGVWIDIFPVDGVSEDSEEYDRIFKQLYKLQMKSYNIRCAMDKFSFERGIKRNIIILVKKILYGHSDIKTAVDSSVRLCQTYDFETSNRIGDITCPVFGYAQHNFREDFSYLLLKDFEDTQFYVCNGYDRALRMHYGDYMQLPPENKRTNPRHINHSVFWKNK